jgi:hypothetical protein
MSQNMNGLKTHLSLTASPEQEQHFGMSSAGSSKDMFDENKFPHF